VGRETAAELLFTGNIIDANRAMQIRLVSRVVPHEQFVVGRDRARAQDRIESAACYQKIEGWTPPRTRSGLEGTWGVVSSSLPE
jgi:enoyl-CoA hydratase/carnithine racemase